MTSNLFRDDILKTKLAINVVLNEALLGKSNELKQVVTNYLDETGYISTVSVSYPNNTFQGLFHEQYDQLQQQPNLLFVDQYGVKEVTREIFQMLIALNKTDFLFFVSSSFMKRFLNTPEFRKYLPDIDVNDIANSNYTDIHRRVLNYYKAQIPQDNDTRLYPFALRKGANIYGLIFGSKHLLGVEKFLDLAWEKNKLNGEANFDIDDDRDKQQPHLFDCLPDYEREKTKQEVYEAKLKTFILSKGAVTNVDVWKFTLDMGHPKSHAKQCISKLRNGHIIDCDGQIGFSYGTCIKNKKIKTIKARNNG